jgi:hypothetical protein
MLGDPFSAHVRSVDGKTEPYVPGADELIRIQQR